MTPQSIYDEQNTITPMWDQKMDSRLDFGAIPFNFPLISLSPSTVLSSYSYMHVFHKTCLSKENNMIDLYVWYKNHYS
jgi:hypothetical protein